MPRKPCYWTRKLELDLVDFVRERDFIWKPIGNTNHHIRQKYKAYAEFAAMLGRGFTARSVRDRWVNIRSTFNHNLRRVDKSKETARSPADVYVPCWPLWKPLQFLKGVAAKEERPYNVNYSSLPAIKELSKPEVKEEFNSDIDDLHLLMIREQGRRTDRPRRNSSFDDLAPMLRKRGQRKGRHGIDGKSNVTYNKCRRVIDDLVRAMKPLKKNTPVDVSTSELSYWFFGKHITERLNSMRALDSECASRDIMKILAGQYLEKTTVD